MEIGNLLFDAFVLLSVVLDANLVIVFLLYVRVFQPVDSIPMLKPNFISLLYHVICEMVDPR